MAELTIIAGPNGAGKSTLSGLLVKPGVFVFDGDKELAELQRRFPSVDDAVLFESVNGNILSDKISDAIYAKEDFAIETNFASDALMRIVDQFKSNGYFLSLIFIGLSSIEQAIARVRLRVDTGGHAVTAENIKNNYLLGLENLSRFYHRFDHCVLIDNVMSREQPIKKIVAVANIQKGRIVSKVVSPPKWTKKIIEAVKSKQTLLPKKRIRKSKGLGL